MLIPFVFFPLVLTNVFVSSSSDELPCFEEVWRGNAKKHLPGWSEQPASRDAMCTLFAFILGVVLLPDN